MPGRAELRIVVVIPAFQAAATVRAVVAGARTVAPVYLVDDGSTDGTGDAARETDATLLTHATNRGKGAALATGIAAALAGGAEVIVTLDADGQHPPACIPLFLAALPEADIVIGSRLHDASTMPRERRLSNRATAAILSALAGQTIVDGQSGYRLLVLDALDGLDLAACGFMFESELLVKASRHGARIAHVPIPCVYADEKSHIRAPADTLRFLWLVVRSFFW